MKQKTSNKLPKKKPQPLYHFTNAIGCVFETSNTGSDTTTTTLITLTTTH